MVLIADKQRRVVLPSVKPGEAFECTPCESGFVLKKLQRAPKGTPPVSKKKVNAKLYKNINLDAPAFTPFDSSSV